MKLFLRIALFMFLIITFSSLFSANAANDRVIFIANNAEGDGSSAKSPLKPIKTSFADLPIETNKDLQYESAMFQAAYMLKHTGGTIVICGEYTIDNDITRGSNVYIKDMILPYHTSANITFTSVYDGVDYRKTNSARLILETPACIELNGMTTFENITICTKPSSYGDAEGRKISASGFKTVIGEGVECVPLDADKNVITNPSVKLYPNLSGGTRYLNSKLATDLTVLSGKWNIICAGIYGIEDESLGHQTNNTKLYIGGDAEVLGAVYGTSQSGSSKQSGNIEITIANNNVKCAVYMVGPGGLTDSTYTAKLIIKSDSISNMIRATALIKTTRSLPMRSIVYLNSMTGDTAKIQSKFANFDTIIIRPEDAENITLESMPSKTTYFPDENIDLHGLTVKVIANDKSNLVSYADCPDLFSVSNAGKNKDNIYTIYYGQKEIGEFEVEFGKRPSLTFEGAKIRADGAERQTMALCASVSVESLKASSIDTTSYGFIAYPAKLYQGENFDPDSTYGGKYISFEGNLFALDKTKEKILFTGYLNNIPVEEYSDDFYIVSYYKYQSEGTEFTVYSKPEVRSVLSIAKNATSSKSSENFIVRNMLQASVISKADGNIPSTYNQKLVDAKVDKMLGFMKQQSEVEWVCREDIDFKGYQIYTANLQFEKGKTYKGIPYVGGKQRFVGYEEFLLYIEEGTKQYIGPTGWNTMYGSMCTSGVNLAMTRYINSDNTTYYIMSSLIPVVGANYFKVGDYVLEDVNLLTTDIIENSGKNLREQENNIYSSYAQSKSGDFIISKWISTKDFSDLGHIRIVSSEPVVVYNLNGTINGSKSYLLTDEQCSTMDKTTHSNWKIKYKYTFAQLLNTGYIPVRINALETGYFETPYCLIENANTPNNICDSVTGIIRSNYDIHGVTVRILSEGGKEEFIKRSFYYFSRDVDISTLEIDKAISALSNGTYTYIVNVLTADEDKEYISFTFTK